jgi:hypothetical protein
MVKNVLDGTYIIEQILPYFSPAWQATLTVNDDLGTKHDIPIILNDITQEDTYEGYFEQRRAIIWTLTFTMKAWFFGPTLTANTGIIKNIQMNFRNVATNLDVFEDANTTNSPTSLQVQISPGVDLNSFPVNMTNGYVYTYTLGSSNGLFIPTEKIINSANSNNYAYVKQANSTSIVSINNSNTLEANSQILGTISGTAATITEVNISPEVLPWQDVLLDSNYGFIYDIYENT